MIHVIGFWPFQAYFHQKLFWSNPFTRYSHLLNILYIRNRIIKSYHQFASFALVMPERLRTNEERQTWLQKPGGSYSVLSSVICFTLNEQICSKNKWDAAICHHNRIDYILWHYFISYLLPSSSSSSTPRKTLVFVQYLHLCVQCTVIH